MKSKKLYLLNQTTLDEYNTNILVNLLAVFSTKKKAQNAMRIARREFEGQDYHYHIEERILDQIY